MIETRILFQGREFLLIGDMGSGGAIATKEQYESFKCSYAHLQPNGEVMRFGAVIGKREDITIIDTVPVNFNPRISTVIDAICDP